MSPNLIFIFSDLNIFTHVGFHKWGYCTQNGWFIMEIPSKMDDDWGYPYDSGNLHTNFSADAESQDRPPKRRMWSKRPTQPW